MRCLECGAEFDEMNESQPVCPGCGAPLGAGRDDADIVALMDDAAAIAAAPVEPENDDPGLELDQPIRMPVDLQEALNDAEALLLATGHVTFDLPEGFRMFPLPTERVM
ncbi:MAG: zinc ribbon domain-containing protein [Bryobacterales bacterium]|nr:zinc ribbon domain-containing protein [Bryobacterales bacterium]